jgi:hypothetical protein
MIYLLSENPAWLRGFPTPAYLKYYGAGITAKASSGNAKRKEEGGRVKIKMGCLVEKKQVNQRSYN